MFRNLILILLTLAICTPSISGQYTRYKTSTALEGGLLGIGAATTGVSLVLQKNHAKLTAAEIESLSIDHIPKIDRWVTQNWDPTAHQISNGVLYSAFALPLAFLLDSRGNDEIGHIGLHALEALLINNGIGNITKHAVRRVRPFVYGSNAPMCLKTKANANLSFYSGHTSNVACMYFLSARTFSDLYPNSDARPLVWTTAAVIPAIQGLLRVKAGKHFVTDVLAGYIAGAAIGLLVPALHK